jgi:hypothetical protein
VATSSKALAPISSDRPHPIRTRADYWGAVPPDWGPFFLVACVCRNQAQTWPSTKAHSQPSLIGSSIASVAALTSRSLRFLVLPQRVHQLALLWVEIEARLLSSAARTVSALHSVLLPTPPLTLASVSLAKGKDLVPCHFSCTLRVCKEPMGTWLSLVPVKTSSGSGMSLELEMGNSGGNTQIGWAPRLGAPGRRN